MEAESVTYWQPPPFTASAEKRMGWIEEYLQESEGWMAGQKAFKNLGQNMRVFDAIFNDDTKSTLVSNGLKYDVRKFISTLSDVREIGTFGSDAPQWKPYAEMLNRMAKYHYNDSRYPEAIRKALQYACVTGMGYIWPKCKTEDYGYGERKIIFEAGGLLDVMPIQIPATNNVEDAYAVTMYEYMPIAEAHGRFPEFASQLLPVARQKYATRIQAKRLSYAELYRYGMSVDQRNWGNLYCEIRYTFIRDLAVNRYGQTIPMGDLGTSWFYEVPAIGQQILAGVRGGQPFMRAARVEDCRIYPYLRCMISSYGMTTPMYDGPGFDWHAKMPPVQYTVEQWAWEPTGRAMVEDVAAIETTIRKTERKMDAVNTVSLNPPMAYDRGAAGGPEVENFDLFGENVRFGVDGDPDHIFKSILPESVKVNETHFKFLEYLVALRGKQLGLEDVQNLENLKLNLSGDQAEKIAQSLGPLGMEIAMNIEGANGRVAARLKFMIPQWDTTSMIVSIVGPENIAPQVFDYDPDSMIPSHMPEEYVPQMNILTGDPGFAPPATRSAFSQVERARRFAKMVRVISVPSTQLKVTQMEEQLKYLQLQQKGFPISFHTVAKKLNIDNYGDIKGTTEFEKWKNEQLEMIEIKGKLAQIAAALMPQQPDQGQGKGSAKAGGRPSSQAKPPKIKQKGKSDGAPRTTITNS